MMRSMIPNLPTDRSIITKFDFNTFEIKSVDFLKCSNKRCGKNRLEDISLC